MCITIGRLSNCMRIFLLSVYILTPNFYYLNNLFNCICIRLWFWLFYLILFMLRPTNRSGFCLINWQLFLVVNGKCSFAFSFLRCILEDNAQLKEVWMKYDDGIDLKVFLLYLYFFFGWSEILISELRVSCHVFKHQMPEFYWWKQMRKSVLHSKKIC
jgi:hypothetical protein